MTAYAVHEVNGRGFCGDAIVTTDDFAVAHSAATTAPARTLGGYFAVVDDATGDVVATSREAL